MMIGTVGFCIGKMVRYGFINNIADDFLNVKMQLVIASVDFIWFTMILVACRPRKEWPAFFTLSVTEMGQAGPGLDGNERILAPPPLLTSLINEKLLSDQFDAESQIGTDDAVLFVNPTKYTLDPTDLMYSTQ